MQCVWTRLGSFKRPRGARVHFSAFAAVAVVLAALAGCAAVPRQPPPHAPVAQPLARLDLPASSPSGRATARVIAAEFQLQDGNVTGAATDYMAAARLSHDPAVAARAFRVALAADDAAGATRMVDRWQALGASPGDVAGARGQVALLRGDAAAAERDFRVLLASGTPADWKAFAAALFSAPDATLAGGVLESLTTPASLPAHAETIWVAMSQLGEHLGKHAFARRIAAAAVLRFHDADGIIWYAGLRLADGDRTAAQALYAEGLALHPQSASLRLAYAALLGRQHRYADALRVLARGPQTHATWSARVGLAVVAKDRPALRNLYAQLRHAPVREQADNAYLLGQLAELLDHDTAALHWYSQVDPDGDHAFDAALRSAALLDKAGKSALAHAQIVELQQDYADDPDSLRTAYEAGAQLYASHGQHAKAIAVYTRGLAALPDDPELRYDRGVEEADGGETDAALADFRAVLAKDPGDVEAMNALGFTLADANRDLPEATRLLRKALKAQPDTAAVLDSWGWLQYRLGNLQAAATYLQRAWARQDNPDIGVHLGEVLWKLGQRQSARGVFARVRKLDPANASLRRVEGELHP